MEDGRERAPVGIGPPISFNKPISKDLRPLRCELRYYYISSFQFYDPSMPETISFTQVLLSPLSSFNGSDGLFAAFMPFVPKDNYGLAESAEPLYVPPRFLCLGHSDIALAH